MVGEGVGGGGVSTAPQPETRSTPNAARAQTPPLSCQMLPISTEKDYTTSSQFYRPGLGDLIHLPGNIFDRFMRPLAALASKIQAPQHQPGQPYRR